MRTTWMLAAACTWLVSCGGNEPATTGASDTSTAATSGGATTSGTGGGPAGTGGSTVASGTGGAMGTGGAIGAGGAGGATGAGGGAVYPPGPYGTTKGSVIADYELQGFVDSTLAQTLVAIRLGDFYNPTGKGTYPPGSQYGAGSPMPKALLIDLGSAWCGPCNQEAATILPGKYAQYAPQAGEFLYVVWDGQTPGNGATPTTLATWTTKYKVDYPAAIDPPHQFLGGAPQAFPSLLLIDPRTMTITDTLLGSADAAWWTKFEALLAAP